MDKPTCVINPKTKRAGIPKLYKDYRGYYIKE